MVLAPYQDLLKAATYRSVTNEQLRHCAQAVAILGSEAQALRQALEAQKHSTKSTRMEADEFRLKYRDCTDDLIKQANRARKPNLQGILLGTGIGLVTGALLFTLAP